MAIQYIARRSTLLPAVTKPWAAAIYVDSDDNKLKYVPAGSGTTEVTIADSTSGIQSTSGSIGFATGAGGTVTQATSKSTAVTLSKYVGQITMNGAALAAAAEATFTVTNTLVAATDVAIVVHSSAGTSGAYMAVASNFTAGTFDITVTNQSGGSLSEAIVLTFVIIKGASA